ncbi:MAG TPA: alpha-glucosidase/alpha-galactosidase [Spirochaetota bacterium]|nr:alpha-glucosidase/alpha-galactosidase [Spirochaetota bacterium]
MSKKETRGHFEHSKKGQNPGMAETVQRPLKIVFLGAGSGFFETLFIDLMCMPGAAKSEMVLIDPDQQRLQLAEALGKKLVKDMESSWQVSTGSDRRQAFKGADYIISCVEISGVDTVRLDNDIPFKYGVDQCIADTIGPGGLMKAMRTAPTFLEILRDAEEICPRALVLNYTNPMSILCLAAARASRTRVLGLCHGVQGTSHNLADYCGVPYAELKWRCAGVNHLSWFTTLEHRGKDLYPELKERVKKDRELWEKDPVRFDVMEHFDYFITEGSGHDSEYLPYYRKRPDLIKRYCRDGYLGETGFYAREWPGWRKNNDQRRRNIIAGKEVGGELPGAKSLAYERSWEYTSWIIQAIETNQPFVAYINLPNHGLIDNLPQDGVVEVASICDRNGVTPTHYGALPPQCAAICRTNMNMFDLAATACVERSLKAAEQALMLDPLTAAVCSPAEIRSMFKELYEAQRAFLQDWS